MSKGLRQTGGNEMKTKLKKLWSGLLCTVLLMSLLPSTAFAADNPVTPLSTEDTGYELEKDTADVQITAENPGNEIQSAEKSSKESTADVDTNAQDTQILSENDEMLVCGNNKTIVTENDGHSHRTNEPAILFFYKKHWFNVIGQLKPYGLFYYCNMASPYLIDGNIIKYIDYDLDLRDFPDGGFRVLDRNEYKYHRHLMKYGKDLNSIIEYSLSELIELKKNNSYNFQKEIVEKFYQKFLEIKEK